MDNRKEARMTSMLFSSFAVGGLILKDRLTMAPAFCVRWPKEKRGEWKVRFV